MNKTIIINISGIIFHIEEDAYERLKNYMTDIKVYFSKTVDNFEIISDIENRIAELFSEIINAEEKQVIIMQDVDRVIRTMGQPADFDAGISDEEADPVDESFSDPKNIKKRLYRNPDDKIVGGVCSGIAEYINTDPIWIRLAVVFSVIFFGTGILLYLILWVIMPEAKTRTEKLSMRGEKPTIESIRRSVQEEIGGLKRNFENGREEFRNNSGIRDMISSLSDVTIKIAALLAKVFVKAVAALVMFTSGAGIFALTMVAATFLGIIDANVDADIPLLMLRSNNEFLLCLGWYLVFTIPLIAIFMVGFRLLFNTNPFNKFSGWTMLSIWVLSLFVSGYYTVDTLTDFKEEGRLQQTVAIQPSSSGRYYLLSDQLNSTSNFDSIKTEAYGLKDKMVLRSKRFTYGLDNIDLRIEKSETNEMKLVTVYYGRGFDEREAIKSAETIEYLYKQNDSVLIFPTTFSLKDKSVWRKQEVRMTLYVPHQSELIIQDRVDDFIHNIYSGECVRDEYDRTTWIMGNNGMECKK